MRLLALIISTPLILTAMVPIHEPKGPTMCEEYAWRDGLGAYTRWALCQSKPLDAQICKDHVCDALSDHQGLTSLWLARAKYLNCHCKQK